MKNTRRDYRYEFKELYKEKYSSLIELELHGNMTIKFQSNTPINLYFRNERDKHSYSKVYDNVDKVIETLIEYLNDNFNYTKEEKLINGVTIILLKIQGERKWKIK